MSSTSSIRSGTSDVESGVTFPSASGDNPRPESEEKSSQRRLPSRNIARYGSVRMSGAMEDFLYQSLVSDGDTLGTTFAGSTSDNTPEDHHRNRRMSSGLGSIFETSFDLTEARLRRLFDLFDKDQNGTISYDEMKDGFKYHGGGLSNLDDFTCDQIISYLDKDQSGNITFEEFSEGIRLLMLRSLLKTTIANNKLGGEDSVATEVFDYNATRLERHIVEGLGQDTTDMTISRSVQPISIMDFFFADRPDWVTVRWINITGRKASHTMKMTALKYRLHPLALEDALDCENQRPKAESYSSHYFIMVPVFFIEKEEEEDDSVGNGNASSSTTFSAYWSRWRKRRKSGSTTKNGTEEKDDEHAKIKGIGIQMTSIFVSMPNGKTVITFNNANKKKDVQVTIDSRHRTTLSDCWSRVQNELKKSYSKLRQYDGQYLAYSFLDQAVDMIGPVVKELRKAIELETESLSDQKYKNMDRIHMLRDELKNMERKLKQFLRLLVHVIEDETIRPGPTVYLKDVLDNLENCDEEVKNLISICESADVAAEKFERGQMDATLYTLTVISATFLPAQFLTGVWGMNFVYMPELDEEYGYRMFWSLAVVLIISMLLFLNCGRLRA